MTAHTTLPNGDVVRWHAPPSLSECTDGECEQVHATRAELDDFTDALRQHDIDAGRAAVEGDEL